MKKVSSIILALVLLLTSAVAFAEVVADEKDFVITMSGNPTTGYDWQYVISVDGVISMTDEFLTSEDMDKLAGIESENEMLSGAGGLYIFTLKGLKPGDVLVAFEYGQSWDETTTVVGITYAFTVNEDLSVVCKGSTVGVV